MLFTMIFKKLNQQILIITVSKMKKLTKQKFFFTYKWMVNQPAINLTYNILIYILLHHLEILSYKNHKAYSEVSAWITEIKKVIKIRQKICHE